MLTLSKPPVTAQAIEQAWRELWNQFLKGFFDGAAHPLDGEGGPGPIFPLCGFAFGPQANVPQPSEIPQIHLVMADLQYDGRGGWLGEQKLIQASMTTTAYVRVPVAGDSARADHSSEDIAALLLRLLQGGDRFALSRRNIRHLRVRRGPVALAVTGLRCRMIVFTSHHSLLVSA